MSVLDTTTYAIAVSVGGTPIPPENVVCDVTIRSGRTRQDDGLEPASCTLELTEADPGSVVITIEQVLTVTVDGAARFEGRISEMTRTPLGATGSTWTVVAVGQIARLARFLLTLPLPAETALARADRVLTAIGFAHTIEGGVGLTVGAYGQAGDPAATADQILGQLITDTGVVIADKGDGSILVQFMDGRLSDDTWTPDPAVTSTDLAFAQSDDVINDIRVGWVGGSVTAISQSSIDLYDRRSVSLDTQLGDVGSATSRATSIIARLARPAWAIDSVTTWDRGFFDHEIGALVNVGPLPAGSPVASPWQGVMEGWVEHYQPSTDGSGRVLGSFLVAVGDRAHSVEILQWIGVTPGLQWKQVDPATSWEEALSNDTLSP